MRSSEHKFPDARYGRTMARIVGLPKRFRLSARLEEAKTIRLATAFAHWSGWRLVATHIATCKGSVKLLTGLSFCQTEPKVLHEWHTLARARHREAYLCLKSKPTFHPKVLIVEGHTPKDSFAIVGSGNLSEGGLLTNTECSVFVSDSRHLRELVAWFDTILDEATPLRKKDIEKYIPKYKKAAKARNSIRGLHKQAAQEIRATHTATMRSWASAVTKAKGFFAKAHSSWYRSYEDAAKEIRRIINSPVLDFTRADWDDFYAIPELGKLDPRHKAKAISSKKRLTRGLACILDDGIGVADRIDAVVARGGRLYVPHLGMNAATKTLASYYPDKWPVWNTPVAVALDDFGYDPPRGASKGQKYEVYAELMQAFVRETGARNMIELDCFLGSHGRKILGYRD